MPRVMRAEPGSAAADVWKSRRWVSSEPVCAATAQPNERGNESRHDERSEGDVFNQHGTAQRLVFALSAPPSRVGQRSRRALSSLALLLPACHEIKRSADDPVIGGVVEAADDLFAGGHGECVVDDEVALRAAAREIEAPGVGLTPVPEPPSHTVARILGERLLPRRGVGWEDGSR